jgi:hydrogenase expression/formation protein HypD
MRFIDEYRDSGLAERLVAAICSLATRQWVIMEVCGGQTHSLLKFGIDESLRTAVELIHGPGCPVCVTDSDAIDLAIDLAGRPDCVLAGFGDMLRVPGSVGSLLAARTNGGRVLQVYSPVEAVAYADKHPHQQVVFFAVGFETTAPATALAVLQARARGLKNFSLLTSHVQVLPAMEQMVQAPDNRVQAFLAAGHVCTITGFAPYETFVRRHRVPVAVTGFEPIDLLQGILDCVQQLENGSAQVKNLYRRSVTRFGNLNARQLVDSVFESCDQVWRGFGQVSDGGLRLRSEFREFDAGIRFPSDTKKGTRGGNQQPSLPGFCRAGEVLAGRLKPCDCEEFARGCHPDSPLGAPMVSSEGACAAYYQYHSRQPNP